MYPLSTTSTATQDTSVLGSWKSGASLARSQLIKVCSVTWSDYREIILIADRQWRTSKRLGIDEPSYQWTNPDRYVAGAGRKPIGWRGCHGALDALQARSATLLNTGFDWIIHSLDAQLHQLAVLGYPRLGAHGQDEDIPLQNAALWYSCLRSWRACVSSCQIPLTGLLPAPRRAGSDAGGPIITETYRAALSATLAARPSHALELWSITLYHHSTQDLG